MAFRSAILLIFTFVFEEALYWIFSECLAHLCLLSQNYALWCVIYYVGVYIRGMQIFNFFEFLLWVGGNFRHLVAENTWKNFSPPRPLLTPCGPRFFGVWSKNFPILSILKNVINISPWESKNRKTLYLQLFSNTFPWLSRGR